jgi:hypothetical protein
MAKKMIEAWIMTGEESGVVEIPGLITEDATKLTKRILKANQEDNESPMSFKHFKDSEVVSDSANRGWRTIIWNFSFGGQGSDQPVVLVINQR